MNREEFFDWLKTHRANFPNFTGWLDKLKSVREEVKERWYRELELFPLDDAIKASGDLLKAPNKPFKYEDHLGEIVGRCKEIAIKRAARRDYARFGAQTRCPHCQGDGQTAIFGRVDPDSGARSFEAFAILADVQSPEVGEKHLRTIGVRCVCPAGEKFNGLPQLDPERHIVVEGSRGWRAASDLPGHAGLTWWERIAERFEQSATAAFATGVPAGGEW